MAKKAAKHRMSLNVHVYLMTMKEGKHYQSILFVTSHAKRALVGETIENDILL